MQSIDKLKNLRNKISLVNDKRATIDRTYGELRNDLENGSHKYGIVSSYLVESLKVLEEKVELTEQLLVYFVDKFLPRKPSEQPTFMPEPPKRTSLITFSNENLSKKLSKEKEGNSPMVRQSSIDWQMYDQFMRKNKFLSDSSDITTSPTSSSDHEYDAVEYYPPPPVFDNVQVVPQGRSDPVSGRYQKASFRTKPPVPPRSYVKNPNATAGNQPRIATKIDKIYSFEPKSKLSQSEPDILAASSAVPSSQKRLPGTSETLSSVIRNVLSRRKTVNTVERSGYR